MQQLKQYQGNNTTPHKNTYKSCLRQKETRQDSRIYPELKYQTNLVDCKCHLGDNRAPVFIWTCVMCPKRREGYCKSEVYNNIVQWQGHLD